MLLLNVSFVFFLKLGLICQMVLFLLREETNCLFVLPKQTNWSRIPALKCQEKQTDKEEFE